MATIQKRLRFRATFGGNGSTVEAKSFSREAEARRWLAEREREALEAGTPRDDLKAEINQRASYRVMVRLQSRPTQYATFKRKTDAKHWGQQTEEAIREGRYFATAEAKKHTLAELIERYEREVLSQKSESKRRDQERHLRWWKDRIGTRTLSDVTSALVSEYRSVLVSETTVGGKKRSPATVNRYLTSLSHAFAVAAREWEWLGQSPVRNVKKLREPRGRVRFLSDEERSRLLAACQVADDSRLYVLVVLAVSTGARQGELLRLRWPDIDLRRGVAVLHQTKNDERRALPLTGLALAVLTERSKVRRLDTDLVFANSEGQPIFPRKAWEDALRAAQIEDFRFHDLRHSAASYLAMSGATLAEIAEVLGHKTLAMVKRYSHLTDLHTSKVVARMNEKIFGSQH